MRRKLSRPTVRESMSRSEEHTSELQSLRQIVCRLLLEKKDKTGAGVEHGGAIGGFARIVTKQGTNTLSGREGLYLRSSSLYALATSGDLIIYQDVRAAI